MPPVHRVVEPIGGLIGSTGGGWVPRWSGIPHKRSYIHVLTTLLSMVRSVGTAVG